MVQCVWLMVSQIFFKCSALSLCSHDYQTLLVCKEPHHYNPTIYLAVVIIVRDKKGNREDPFQCLSCKKSTFPLALLSPPMLSQGRAGLFLLCKGFGIAGFMIVAQLLVNYFHMFFFTPTNQRTSSLRNHYVAGLNPHLLG